MSKKRKATSKRLRFEVFNRDHFTCQYCGAQPPDVVLVCDHIEPVALGGMTTADNLIAACEACNQGKADKALGSAAIRPDADLMYLRTQQEIVEQKKYQESVRAKELALEETVIAFHQMWGLRFMDDWFPNPKVLMKLLDKYEPEIVEQALMVLGPKVESGYVSKNDAAWAKYLWKTVKNIAEEEEEGLGQQAKYITIQNGNHVPTGIQSCWLNESRNGYLSELLSMIAVFIKEEWGIDYSSLWLFMDEMSLEGFAPIDIALCLIHEHREAVNEHRKYQIPYKFCKREDEA